MKNGQIVKFPIVIAIMAVIVICMFPAMAAPAPESHFTFDSSTGTITEYLGSGGVVEIPASIGGKPVNAIGYQSFALKYNITSVIIPAGVTRIDSQAFLKCYDLESITIPDSVTSIGDHAFQDCGNLTAVTIPVGVAAIDSYTFRNCSKLAYISLPDGLTSIGERAFGNCSSLESIDIPSTVTSIETYAFQSCSKLQSITIPNGVARINSNTFNSCSNLKSVTLPAGLTDIGESAFFGCSSLTSINIPDNVTSIGSGAFASCTGLTSITLPSKLTSLSQQAFSQCNNLGSITIPNSVTSIGVRAFYYCRSLSSISIPNSVTSIGESAFEGCNNLSSITIPTGVTVIRSDTFKGCSKLESIFIPYGVTSIGSNAFQGCSSLTSINIPESIIEINLYAFNTCSKLESITIPDSIEYIGAGAFGLCSSLTSISLPDSITIIYADTFYGCTKLENLIIPDSVTSIGSSAFRNCSSLKSINIPETVNEIREYAFYGCNSLESLIIPDSVTSIGEYAFADCIGLTSISIPNTATSISKATFKGCSSLESIDLPGTVTSIGASAFEGCSNLKSIIIPNEVTQISEDTFLNCSQLTTVILPEGLNRIEGGAFHSCPALKNITIPAGVTYIGQFTFYDCRSLESINIPTGVTAIENGAFRNCINLAGISIPDEVTSIGDEAFSSCSSLTSVTIPATVTSIGNHAFSFCSSLASIVIPDEVTSIGQYAFAYCTSLGSIVLPDKLTFVDQRAFQGCSSLTKASFTGNAPTMFDHVFTDTAAGFKVYYFRGKTGFPGGSGGLWYGYNAFPLVSITYDANDSSSGSVPTDSELYEQGQIATVQGNTGGLTHEEAGYVFVGWNTAPDGSGSLYAAGDTFAVAGGNDIMLYAQWRTVHTVLWMSQDGSTILEEDETAPYGYRPEFNSALPVKASTPAYSYTFAGWAASPDQTIGTAEASLPAVAGDVTYYAAFSPTLRSYTVTFNSNGGSAVSSQTVDYDTTAAEPDAPAKTGHTFAGWCIDSGLTSAYDFSTPVTGDIILYAKWTANIYTVTFNSNGGSAVSSQSVSYGTTAVEPTAPAKTGHTFAEWNTDSELTAPFDFATPITDDLILYARWTVNTYTVTFNSNGGSAVSSQGVIYNNTATAPEAPSKTGYAFAGWHSDSGLISAYDFSTPVTGDITLYAKWTPNTYTLFFDAQGGSSAESSRIVTYKEPVGALPAASKPGHTLAGWYTGENGSGTEYTAETDYDTVGDLTLYVKWTVNTYTVSFDSNGGSAVSSQNIIYNYTATAPTAPTRTGHTFVGWYSDSGLTSAYDFSTPLDDDLTLYAKWTPNAYSLFFDPQGGSEVLPMPVTYNAQIGTLPASSKSGYALKGWYTGTDGSGIKYTAEMVYETEGDMTLYAVWDKLYSITYSLNEGSGTAPIEADKVAGATFAAADPSGMTAPSGKRFKAWNTAADGKGTSYLPGETVTMREEDLLLYAIWEVIPVDPEHVAAVDTSSGQSSTLTVKVNAVAGVATVDAGSQKLDAGETVITIPSVTNINTYSARISVPELSKSEGQGTLTLNTDAGSITVPSNMLTGVPGVDGSRAEIVIGQGDKDRLPDDVKSAIGDKPLIFLALTVDGKQTDWSNPNAPVTVSIPYTPTAAELNDPGSIVVWYIDGSGNVVAIPNGYFDPVTGMVTFRTTHFSDFAVAYQPVGFNDVASGAWYNEAVSFIAARKITAGTGSGDFSPEAKLTRGEFIVMIMRANGIAPEQNPTDNFKDAGDTYYTGYLAAAKRLGISAGIGGSLFAPDRVITRQEMFTLLYNALKVIGRLPAERDDPDAPSLSDFADAEQIDAWAREAMTLLVQTGKVSGSAGKLMPRNISTRAEAAQVIYKLLIHT